MRLIKHANNLLLLLIALISCGFWAILNQPEAEPPWPKTVSGFAFSPFRAGQNPLDGSFPTKDEIASDLAFLASKSRSLRTYSVTGVLGEIPQLAGRYGLDIVPGAWIDTDRVSNLEEIQQLVHLANRYPHNVARVIVGNETIYRDDLSIDELLVYLDSVGEQLQIPVSTAEPWHVWLKHPQLVRHVDYIAVHLLPYWEGIAAEDGLAFIESALQRLRAAYPKKPIVIAEVGWPSNGRMRDGAVASQAKQAIFLRRFIAWAEQEGYTYYLMEAFDQPWKQADEGAVGAYWGVYDLWRQAKFNFTAPIIKVPQWPLLALISALLAIVLFCLLLTDGKRLRLKGRLFLALFSLVVASTTVWVGYTALQLYLSLTIILVGVCLITLTLGVITLFLIEAHEWAEASWRRRPTRSLVLPQAQGREALPFVSIHLAAYNEPPAMVKQTLDALSRLNYPAFEVIVVDNNTKDPTVWRPVQAHCRTLGERFRFFHLDSCEGFKAGALNYALNNTAQEAVVIAVIDSDYLVEADWLRDLTPHFLRQKVAIVQAPQDYRDDETGLFKSICNAEYKGFFHIGMVIRNERNAIIQHGTMTLVRRRVLEEVGGWGQWTVTEDAELGMRILAQGYEALYTSQSYGKGLTPDSFSDYKKQRHRWAYGAMQILFRYGRELLGRCKSGLTPGQRFHFIAGWLPWVADGFHLLFSLLALLWTLAMILAPQQVDPPMVVFTILPVMLFLFKLLKQHYLYLTEVGTGIKRAFFAAVSGLALSHTIGSAVVQSLVSRQAPFFRTPKMRNRPGLSSVWLDAREEWLLMLALWLAAGGVATLDVPSAWDLRLWVCLLLIQSLSYLAAVIITFISVIPGTGKGPRLVPKHRHSGMDCRNPEHKDVKACELQ